MNSLSGDMEGFDGSLVSVRKTCDSLGRVTFESAPSDAGPSTQGTCYQQYGLLGRLTCKLVLWDAHVLA